MRVLGLDSCGPETTLAVAEIMSGEVEVLRVLTLPARTAGARLTGALGELLGATSPAALAALVVVRGPGSFTGMRVGLSAAKALAEAAGVPLAAVSRLAVLAGSAHTGFVALDAGRGGVYLRTAASGEERLLTAAEARAAIGSEGALTVCEDRVAGMFPRARQVPPPTAADALRCARGRVLAGDWDDTAALDALYLWEARQMLGTAAQ